MGFFKKTVILLLFSLSFFISSPVKAAGVSINLAINPSSITKNLDEQFSFDLIINNLPYGKGVSGFDICVDYDPTIAMISTAAEPVDKQNVKGAAFTQLKKDIDNGQGSLCVVYVVIAKDADLPKSVTIPITLKAKKPGATKLHFSKAQIVGNIDNHLYDVKKSESLITVVGLRSSRFNLFLLLKQFFDNLVSLFKR